MMCKCKVKTKMGFKRDLLLEQLLGGTSLREPKEVVPNPEFNFGVHNETLQKIESLSETRDLHFLELWEKLIFVINSPECGVSLGDIEEDTYTTGTTKIAISPRTLKELGSRAKTMNVSINDLLSSGIIKLEKLLHDADNYEYEVIKRSESTLQEIQSKLENAEYVYQDCFDGIFGCLSKKIRKSLENTYAAQRLVTAYLSAHTLPPKVK